MCFVFSAFNEKPIYVIINAVVKITNILPPETITNVLNQQMQVTKVLAYDDTNSININIYGELASTIEKDNVYSMTFLQIHNYSLQRLLKTEHRSPSRQQIQKSPAVLLILKQRF